MKNSLRVLRTQCGWTQQALATRLGVSRQTVNAIETGKYDPSLPLAFAIARVFGRPIEEIFDPGGDRPEGDGARETEPEERKPEGTGPEERNPRGRGLEDKAAETRP